MEGFSLDRAWSRGVTFISARARDHGIILVGIGVLLSTAIQYAAVGGTTGFMNPAMMGTAGASAVGAAFASAAFVAYLLQIGSFFGSWKLGLDREASLGGAIGWGMLAALLFMVTAFVLALVAGLTIMVAPAAGMILTMLVLLPLAIILYSVFVVMIGLLMFAGFGLGLLFGAAAGAPEFLAGTFGEGLLAFAVFAALSVLVLWLSARLCCTGPAMARHRTFNVFAGIAESWRVTGPAQWRILGYLLLVAIVLGILLFVFAMIAGVSMMAEMDAGDTPQFGVGALIGGVLAGIAIAYILVVIPAGIYRAASGEAPVDVFA